MCWSRMSVTESADLSSVGDAALRNYGSRGVIPSNGWGPVDGANRCGLRPWAAKAYGMDTRSIDLTSSIRAQDRLEHANFF